jgi:hypothetical protein
MRLNNRVKMPTLILKRAATSRPSGTWYDDDFDVLCNGECRPHHEGCRSARGHAVDVDTRLLGA